MRTITFPYPEKWIETLENQTKDIRDEVHLALYAYWRNREVPALKPIASALFSMMKYDIDFMNRDRAELSETRRQAAKTVSKNKQKVAKLAKGSKNDIIEKNIIEENRKEEKTSHEVEKSGEGGEDFFELRETIRQTANGRYQAFLQYILDSAPGVAASFPVMKEAEFEELRADYTPAQLWENVIFLENRPDICKRRRSLFLTLRDYCKKGYGKD